MSIRYRLQLIMIGLSILGVSVSSWLADSEFESNLKMTSFDTFPASAVPGLPDRKLLSNSAQPRDFPQR